MKNTILLFLTGFTMLPLAVLLLSCHIVKKNTSSGTIDPKQNIVGLWTEHWEQDSLNPLLSVEYVDTIKIQLNSSGEYNIQCVNNADYAYDKIVFQDRMLTFRMENKSDPEEQFLIEYTLKLDESEQILQGEIVNTRNEHAKVKLVKIN